MTAAALFGATLTVLGALCWLATEGRGLLKYGPRYWRVERKLERRAWKREHRT